MIQTHLFDKSRQTEAIAIASGDDDYCECFSSWLRDNWEIYMKFERIALKAINKGFQHYSSKTIVELLRWSSDMAEKKSEFKINNNRTPDLARMFEDMNKKHTGFFRSRVKRKAA